MRIGVVCFPTLGGSGIIASELALELAARGHEIHVISSALPGRVVPSERLRFHQVVAPAYAVFEHAPYTIALAGKIIEVSARFRLDVLHVHYAIPHAASAYLARQALGPAAPRVVTSLHGTDVTGVGAHPSYVAVTRFCTLASDGLIAPSEYLAREARQRFGTADDHPIEVIPNFVDTERFSPGERRPDGVPTLFHVSNFRPVKRAGELIELLARVRRDRPARLVLVGDGPDRAPAERRAKELGLEAHVSFLGNRDSFVDELRQADAFILTSEIESFGVAALEALSAGVPVFAYRVGGLPEVVPDGAGALVEPFDVDALGRAVVDALDGPARHAELRRAARAHVLSRFRREPAVDRYEAHFRRVLERS